MKKYSKEFKEEALKLSDETGVRRRQYSLNTKPSEMYSDGTVSVTVTPPR